ncbi:MAG: CAP domain-containing protein [Hyphomonadaceae bacterium]|nr:CAP domain-containing protein [Hyphomonadaceae bacterium]
MLQFYDKPFILSALALAALGGAAQATTADRETEPIACDLSNGFASNVEAYLGESTACLSALEADEVTAVDTRIRALTERHRARYNMDPLAQRTSLDAAARAHAMDMAARGYADHVSPEGLDHLDRVRRLDRAGLYGAMGANITIVPAGTDPIDAFNALISDPVNAENLTRGVFTHAGLGVAQADNGDLYIVQVLAQLDGELNRPAPLSLAHSVRLNANFANARFEHTGWRVETGDAVRLASGGTRGISSRRLEGETGLIEIDARLGTEVFALRGPAISLQ